ncbi:uncharacterized protein [Diadema antillarum]|uniref:uncharacterized protein n=1 Tax=Diadema antillarum TaxID=105358 RepID=UPI003A8819EB
MGVANQGLSNQGKIITCHTPESRPVMIYQSKERDTIEMTYLDEPPSFSSYVLPEKLRTDALAYDATYDTLYFSTCEGRKIFHSLPRKLWRLVLWNRNLTLFTEESRAVYDMEIDEFGGFLYWTTIGTIKRRRIRDEVSAKVETETFRSTPVRVFEIHPYERKIYSVNLAMTAMVSGIYTADMDMKNSKQILGDIGTNHREITARLALELDIPAEMLEMWE